MAHGMAEELSREDQKFLKERAPRLLQVIKEAKDRSFDEVLKEAIEICCAETIFRDAAWQCCFKMLFRNALSGLFGGSTFEIKGSLRLF